MPLRGRQTFSLPSRGTGFKTRAGVVPEGSGIDARFRPPKRPQTHRGIVRGVLPETGAHANGHPALHAARRPSQLPPQCKAQRKRRGNRL
ncbi:hypothetical protein scyTo_0021803 [Scyliorhinus torazame]|uniref:Uncharacterized protein n=1 Tax=Scyliorhinus torazame TaxID=75743 RepID=A0A401Q771_SCYTO|nr:hypothetical protein [Scyliorhinus torazame]